MLKIKKLSKSYLDNKVLDDVSFEVEEGKLTTLLGENGSGKSTLLNLLSGYELPDMGSVTYRGESLDKINFSFIHDIFFVHEKLDYTFPLSVKEYIEILKEKIPKWNQSFFNKMVKDRKININHNFQSLSRGQKMQVSLMIGLASHAKILLLDEITSVIDVYGRKYFLDILEKYVKLGNTVVITTNIVNELEFYTDNLVVIKDKRIALNKKLSEIPAYFVKVRKPNGLDHKIFHHPECVWAGVNSDRSISYVVPIEVYNDFKVPEEFLDKRTSTLEDIFIFYFNKSNREGESYENAA